VRDTDAAEHGLARSRGAVNLKAEVNQLIDDLLDLVFASRIVHCNDHGVSIPVFRIRLFFVRRLLEPE